MIIAQPYLRVGARVKIHSAPDLCMRGERFAVVEKIGRKRVHIVGERRGRMFKIAPSLLERV